VVWRGAAALSVEAALGAGVLAAGLITIAASRTESSAATSTSAPAATATVGSTTTTAVTTSTTSTISTTSTAPSPATTAPAPSATTPPVTAPASTVAPVVTHRAAIDVLAPRAVAAPVQLSIPDLEVDGPVLPAGVNGENELDVPPDARTLVWYRHGPSPGEPGSAVIAGHLNWQGVTGLFANLASTPVGAAVTVTYDDGSQRAFTVTSVELVPKPDVSVNGVFARGGEQVLRLVTCGGEFDDSVNSYQSNVVVTAVPA
jgi:LPXTG-site transpeptidase (sortase) family protein